MKKTSVKLTNSSVNEKNRATIVILTKLPWLVAPNDSKVNEQRTVQNADKVNTFGGGV